MLNDDVVNLATPPDTGALPRVVAPSLKVTVPVAPDGETVVVRVTRAPNKAGFGEAATEVVVEMRLTLIPVLPELAEWVLSPL